MLTPPDPPRRPTPGADLPFRPSFAVMVQYQDRDAQYLLEDPSLARQFVQLVWAPHADLLDWAQPIRVSRLMITADLTSRTNDIWWQVRLNRRSVIVGIEHKGKRSSDYPIQRERYEVLVREQQIRDGVALADLPQFLPIVHYTADEPWSGSLTIQELVEPHPLLARWDAQAPPVFFDLHRTPPQVLEEAQTLLGWALRVQQAAAGDPMELRATISAALAFLSREAEHHWRQVMRVAWHCLLVVFHRRPLAEYNAYRDELRAWGQAQRREIREETEQMEQTMADFCIQQGMRIGEARGRDLGLAEGRAEGIRIGEVQALRLAVTEALQARFGMLPPHVSAAIQAAGRGALTRWLVAGISAQRLEDVDFSPPQTENGRGAAV